ncbi:phosphoglycerate kinase [Uliginosibacterium sp. 31-16]|uniref:phosphoglycerate kinase n=1 Tax=Uliginosibacterium sp. 31-16 TaxID=3068315 RepID=UPI00273D7DC0|nr:phosphoglycerate kinase [Uliginosibacterium sp. 31-16]MDP5239025.1 phosphoglycerate kinase [Uliginosibacterium sp. 31-16]
MTKLFIEDLDLAGKRVLMRVDFNVPVNNGVVESDKRIRAALPTIKYALDKGASVVLMSHLGRPDGKVVAKCTLAPVAERLQKLLGKPVKFLSDCVGAEVEAVTSKLAAGEVVLLENVRYHLEEEGKVKDKEGNVTKATPEAIEAFRAALSRHGDVFVLDAFGTAHRAHSSVVGINLPRASGLLLKKELDFLGEAVNKPVRPLVAIIGGSKISGKIDVVEALLPKVDKLLIGGGMAFTFFKAMGYEVGNSLCELDKVELAKSLMAKAGDKLVLPIDTMVTKKLDFGARTLDGLVEVASTAIPADQEGVDIGSKSAALYADIVRGAKTVLWNGPMGVFEIDASAVGTYAVANALTEATAKGAITIVGGGDSVAAVEKAGLEDQVSHVSTGGGASLEFLEGKALPGVEALSNK